MFLAHREGLQLIATPWGSGSIVAMTSVELWENQHIHCHDNAHLLRTLSGDREKVWWIFDTEMEPLQTIIDEIGHRDSHRLTELPRMVDLSGFGQFLQNLKNQGMHPYLMGDFPVEIGGAPSQPAPRKPYLVR